jgi:hypothetical protein
MDSRTIAIDIAASCNLSRAIGLTARVLCCVINAQPFYLNTSYIVSEHRGCEEGHIDLQEEQHRESQHYDVMWFGRRRLD